MVLIYDTIALRMDGFKDLPVTIPEMAAVLSHCCTLLIGLVVRSLEKVRSKSEYIKRCVKTLMVTIGVLGHGESATHLNMYQPSAAID